jgi:hypothetical protein
LLLLSLKDLVKDFVQINLGGCGVDLDLIADFLSFGVYELDSDFFRDAGLGLSQFGTGVHMVCLLPFSRWCLLH